MSYDYIISLPQFEGPFDLLLFFIERDEVDIYNIPISTITQEFLGYIKAAEQMNIELASDFILFVSNLMRIKAKMLLPRKELNEKGEEIDPRQELIDKILEYKRYKEAAESMALLEAERLLRFKRANIKRELADIGEKHAEGSELQHITAYKLLQAFEKTLKKLDLRVNAPQHVVIKYNFSMESQKAYLFDYFRQNEKSSFEHFIQNSESRIQIIFTFLSILEMVQQGFLNILVGEGRNNLIIERMDKINEETILTSEF